MTKMNFGNRLIDNWTYLGRNNAFVGEYRKNLKNIIIQLITNCPKIFSIDFLYNNSNGMFKKKDIKIILNKLIKSNKIILDETGMYSIVK